MSKQGTVGRAIVNMDRMKREARGENPDSALEIKVGFIDTQNGKGFMRMIQAPNGVKNGDIREYLVKLLQGEFPGFSQSQADLKLTMEEAKVSEQILRESLVEWRESLMGGALFPEGEKWAMLSRTYFYFFHNNGGVATYDDFKSMPRR